MSHPPSSIKILTGTIVLLFSQLSFARTTTNAHPVSFSSKNSITPKRNNSASRTRLPSAFVPSKTTRIVQTATSIKPRNTSFSISANKGTIDTMTESKENGVTCMPFPEDCLQTDHYNGITISVADLPSNLTKDPETFGSSLDTALDIWRMEGRKGIWLHFHTDVASLIPPSIELGFDFHFAEKGKVVLTQWLPDSECRLPLGPTHQVGIGAFVLHPETKKMLVVQEKSGPAAARKLWKMPTGLADPGEDLSAAAIRELKEETNLTGIFDRILCIREAHGLGTSKQKSDMFFVCSVRLDDSYHELLKEGGEIDLTPQEEEIQDIMWMSVKEYAEQGTWVESPLYGEFNRVLFQELERREEGEFTGFVSKNLPIGWRDGSQTIYVNEN